MEVVNVATANQICVSWGNTITVRNQFTEGRAAINRMQEKESLKYCCLCLVVTPN